MGLLPLNQIVQSVATGEAVDTVSVASSASPVQLVDLGISLGQPASALDLGVQILDQSARVRS